MGCLAGKQARQLPPLHPTPCHRETTLCRCQQATLGKQILGTVKTETSPAQGKERGGEGGTQGYSCGGGRGFPAPCRGGLRGRSPASPMLLPAASLGRGGTGSRIPGPPSPPRGRTGGCRGKAPVCTGFPGPCRPPRRLPLRCPGFPRGALAAEARPLLRVPWQPPNQSQPTSHVSEEITYRLPLAPAFGLHSVLQSPIKGRANKSYMERSDAAIQRPSASP